MSLTLYQLDGCPYCEVVVEVLEDLDLAFDTEWVGGLHSERDEVAAVSGQRQVPVLVDDEYGVTMAESERITEYLRTTYGG